MKLNFKIIYLFILINTMISCHNESKEYNKSNENISILKNDSNNSNDSIILKKDNPVIIFQKESECIENCRNTELVLNKRLRNDTLFIKLAVVRPCKSKNTTQVTLDNDSLKFFIDLQPVRHIVKKKNKIDTIYSFKVAQCDCMYFFEYTIKGIKVMPKYFSLMGIKHHLVQIDSLPERFEIKDSVKIYFLTEKEPKFADDEMEFVRYIQKSLKIPDDKKNIKGKAFVQVIINKDGVLHNVKILKGVDSLIDKELIKVIESSPKWTPAIENGKFVNCYYTIPININK